MSASSNADLSQYSAEHQARRLASRGAPQHTPPPRRRFGRELVLIAGIIVAATLVTSQVDSPNPEYPEARANADRLEDVWGSVFRGDSSLKAAADSAGLIVYRFQAEGQTASVLTHTEPTTQGLCYGVRMFGGMGFAVVSFVPTDGCVPQGLSTFESVGWFEDVLPSERVTPWWVIPTLVILFGGALRISTSIVLKLISR